ncbi:MAG: HDOD domain-containing protein [Leptospiraceae bacterium]|nr:HDOD domain-containing protein [Leptospiraceae bacterium]MDW7976666.1 HDOD domain-containing protein [Leptospiraceae bacterium]
MTISFKQEVQQTLNNIERLPSFPEVVHKVLKLLRDPDVEFKAISKELVKDPGLTADVIRLSNSAYYHPTKEIRSIEEAIKVLGLKVLKEIVMVAAARGILKQPIEGYKLESRDMWEHSLMVGYLSMNIVEKQKIPNVPKDVAFTAGLMHDCGKIVLASTFKKAILLIQQEYQKHPNVSFLELEKKYIGFTHPEIGAFLLKNWNFPEELVDSVLHLYEPEKSTKNPTLTSLIHVSNWLVISAGIGVDVMGMNETLSPFALKQIHFNNSLIQEYYESIPELMGNIKDLIEL